MRNNFVVFALLAVFSQLLVFVKRPTAGLLLLSPIVLLTLFQVFKGVCECVRVIYA